MNVAYILNSTEINGGATKAFLNMVGELMKYDIKPFVVVPDKDDVHHELAERQIPTLAVNYRSAAYPLSQTLEQRLLFIPRLAARIIANRRATTRLRHWLRENDIHIVHSNTGVVRIGFDAAQEVGLPHVYHLREYRDKDFGIKYFPTKESFYKQLNKSNSYSICITKDIQDYHRQKGKASSRVVYDGVFHRKPDMPKVGTKTFFLYAGRIQPAKGLDLLLEAYRLYASNAQAPLHLKVAGSIADNAYYEKQLKFIKTHQLTELVELLGGRDDIAHLMQEARALIVASPFEGFGFSMPEAMQQGCLVIGRNTSGTKEQLDNGLEEEGEEIALRYDTTEKLAKLLSEVACRPTENYLPYLERAFRTVNKLYTAEANAEHIYQFYKDILHGTNTQIHQQ